MREKAKIVGIGIVATLLLANIVVAETQSKGEVNTPAVCSMQPPAVEWEKTFGEAEYDLLYCVQETDDGGYIALGVSTNTDDPTIGYAWLLKLDAAGNEEWSTFETSELWGEDGLMAFVQQTSDGGYIACGWILDYIEWLDREYEVGALWKVDATGTTEWIRWYSQEEEPIITVPWVVYEMDDGYIAAGYVTYSDDSVDAMLMKTDSTGVIEWQKIYTFEGGDSTGRSLCFTNDGGYLIVGYADGAGGGGFYVIKTDASGNMEWDKTVGGPGFDYCYSRNCFQTSDGGYVMNGVTQSFGAGNSDIWFVKTDASGNMEWNETYGENRVDNCWTMETTNDGGYIFTAAKNYGGFTGTKSDVWIVKTDSEGNAQWSQTVGGPQEDRGYYISKTSDGGYIVVGRTESFGAGDSDGWLIKIAPDKELVTPTLQVQKPKSGWIYLFNIIGLPFPFTPNALILGDLTFSVEASDASGISKVEFFIDDKVVGEVTETPYTFEWTEAEKGTYTLKIRAYNNYGGTTQEIITIQKVL